MSFLSQKSASKRGVLVLLGAIVLAAVFLAAEAMVAREEALTKATATIHPAASSTPVVVPPAHHAASLLPVVVQKDILPKHQALADDTLRSLPSYCRDNLKNLYVNYDKNPANRGLGGENTIIVIGNVPDSEFRALLIHECGHVTDLGGLRGTAQSGFSGFMDGKKPVYQNDPSVAFYQISWITDTVLQPGTKTTDFVSGYASSDPFEDFAETYAFFALQKKEFARLAKTNAALKAKYDFMQNFIFTTNTVVAQGTFVRGKQVPWDVTKLPYVWHAKR